MSIQKINEYYRKIADVKQFSGTKKESSIRRCFAELLSDYAQKKELLLVDEYEIKGTRKIADGGLINKDRLLFGYWEAKDTKDDLEKEIQNKIKIGYPTFNIIFENSEIAVLYQNDIREQCEINDAKALDNLLTKFVTYETQEARNFREALIQFGKDVPEIVKVLETMMAKMIQKDENYNADFVEKREKFYQLCKICINPQIDYKDIDEMIIQHILTEDAFRNVFTESQFHEENNIAQSLIAIEKTFFIGDFKRNINNRMNSYYSAIKEHASKLNSYKDKQNFLKRLYEEFYKAYNPKNADKLGIVYTPSEIVSFMLKMTDALLEKHFDKNLIDKNVHILDPATGTGTFITDLLDYLPHNNREKFIYKYKNEIHANEVAILPYYIAYLNIENTFLQKMKESMSFDNLCWVDTLDNVEALKYAGKQSNMFELAENTKRIKAQNDQKISVIIGNPPYNANQQNENDNNKNREYKELDKRIKDSFIKESAAQKTKVYDMYARFYRWAMDRIDKNGIVSFITNRSFIDSRTFDGFRKIAQREFDEIYILDTKSDVRQNPKIAGTTHNVFGIQAGVAIMFLIKKEAKQDKKAKIFYYSLTDEMKKEEKLDWFRDNDFENIAFERIRPDKNANWINLSESDFEELIPICSKDTKLGKGGNAIFELFSLGVITARDEWVYDFDKENLIKKVNFLIDKYNQELSKLKGVDKKDVKDQVEYSIKWSRAVKNDLAKGKIYTFDENKIIEILYRPFIKKYLYFSKELNEMQYQLSKIFDIENQFENLVIGITFHSQLKLPSILATKNYWDYGLGARDTVGIPMYQYSNGGERQENITDWALDLFQNEYKDKKIKKLGIFHYVYAVLHNPDYRKKYEIDLKRDFPRIPLYKDFWKYAEAGEKLMDLHLNYENLPIDKNIKINRLPLESLLPKRKKSETSQEEDEKLLQKIKPEIKLKAKDGVIEIDEITSISNIPNEVWEYKLGNRSAVEWVLDQYKPYKSSDETIQTQFNNYDFFEYKEEVIKLLLQVIYVSVETMKIIKNL